MNTLPPDFLVHDDRDAVGVVVVEGVARKMYPETNIWEVSRPVLEKWLKDTKSPKSALDTAINTSAEIIKRIPDFPDLMDKANYALQLMAEGKLNLGLGNNKNLGAKIGMDLNFTNTDLNFNFSYLGQNSLYNQDLNF